MNSCITLLFLILALVQALQRHPVHLGDGDEVMEGDLPMELMEMIQLVAHQEVQNRRIHRERSRRARRTGTPRRPGGDEANQPIRPWEDDLGDNEFSYEKPLIPSEAAGKRFLKKYCSDGHCRLPRKPTPKRTSAADSDKRSRKIARSSGPRPPTAAGRKGIRALKQSWDRTKGKARQQDHHKTCKADKGRHDGEATRRAYKRQRGNKIRKANKGQPREDRPIAPWDFEETPRRVTAQRVNPHQELPIDISEFIISVELGDFHPPPFRRNPFKPSRPHKKPNSSKQPRKGSKLESNRPRRHDRDEEEMPKEYERPRGTYPPMEKPDYGPKQPPLDGPKHRRKCPLWLNVSKWYRKARRTFYKLHSRFGEASKGEQAVMIAGILAIIAMQVWVIGKCISFATASKDYTAIVDEESGLYPDAKDQNRRGKSSATERSEMLD